MEAELKRTELEYYEPVLETTIYREETLEMIVSDACPDILRIVDTEGRPCLRQRELSGGGLSLRGAVKTVILYTPEGGQGLWRLEAEVPFQCALEDGELSARCRLVTVPQVVSAETRALNPRKVLIRVELAIGVQVYQPRVLSLCCGICGQEEWGIQQRLEQQESSLVACVAEKEFSFSDELTAPGNRGPISEVLRGRGEVYCSESKLIGNKLIFKGGVLLRLLCRGVDATIGQSVYELPFSQIMEVSGVDETALCQLEVTLTDWSFALADGEGRAISVSLELMAQAVLRQNHTLTMLADAYSTSHALRTEPQSCQLWQLVEQGTRRQTAREILETGAMPRTVHDAWMTVTGPTLLREGGQLTLSAMATVTVLYATEEEEYTAISRQLPVHCQLDCDETVWVTGLCTGSELQASATAGGVEVRFAVDFRLLLLRSARISGIAAASVEEAPDREQTRSPSVVLRQLTGGEVLWDLAKAYSTTTEDIMRANELTDEALAVGQLLLIPRKR